MVEPASPADPVAEPDSTAATTAAATAATTAADRRAARAVLGAIFIAAGMAHLARRRMFRSLVPDWLAPMREEIDLAVGGLEVAGGVLLFIPKLRRLARWANMAVLAPAAPALISELWRPSSERVLRRRPMPGLTPVGPAGRAPAHLGAAAVLWWATEPD